MRLSHNALYPARRSPLLAPNVVAASHPLAAQAGLQMLLKGGNAADAALATAIALVVLEPTGNGLGSDAFAIISDGSQLHGLNASGRSPKALSPDRFMGLSEMPQRGWDSVTVPGAVSAWREISRQFGALPFTTLFDPAVEYAEAGFNVPPVIAEVWRRNAEELKNQPGFAEAWMPDGRAPHAGELFVNKPLARSLRLIAETEGEAFYRGELAERIADFAKAHGGAMTVDDLSSHENDWCGTIFQTFGDAQLHEIPPNGQGIAALMTLGILQLLDIVDLDADSADALHLQIEAMKLAFADIGRFVADPLFMKASTNDLLNPAYLATRAEIVDRKKAQIAQAGAPKHGGTVCLATADASEMMVSYIQSNFSGFGSGVVVPGTAISLQNRGAGFTLEQGHPNQVGSAKRPFHTIIPGFIMACGRPQMAFGLMGGPMQAQGHVQMFLRTQIWGQDPQTAADAPRWRFDSGLSVSIEPGYPTETMAALRDLGHEITDEAADVNFGFGGAQLVTRNPDGGYIAGSDPRKDGQAVGF